MTVPRGAARHAIGANRYRGLEPRLLEQKMYILPRATRRALSPIVIATAARRWGALFKDAVDVDFAFAPKSRFAICRLIEAMADEAHHG
jgi:hypothetical protein